MRFAIITPSYRFDLGRCELLCRSVSRHVTGSFHHYLIVDERDRAPFRHLENHVTTVLTVEEILPWWIRRAPLIRGWWLNFKGPPIRNWILQQIVKLSVAECIDAEAYLFADSDIALTRPFATESLIEGNLLRLFRVAKAPMFPGHARWHRSAARLLGLPPTDDLGTAYIGNLITWRREVLRLLHRRIEQVSGRPWIETLSRELHLSEYILYGAFVERVLGASHAGHDPQDSSLCHNSWDFSLETDHDLKDFFAKLDPQSVAVMVSSKLGIDPSRYQHLLEQVRDPVECLSPLVKSPVTLS